MLVLIPKFNKQYQNKKNRIFILKKHFYLNYYLLFYFGDNIYQISLQITINIQCRRLEDLKISSSWSSGLTSYYVLCRNSLLYNSSNIDEFNCRSKDIAA